jgi:integrase/recombinase XerC
VGAGAPPFLQVGPTEFLLLGSRFRAISGNPAALLPAVRLPIRSPRPKTEDVVVAALAAADDRVRLMVLLAARLGLRRREICKVHTEDITTSPLGWSLFVIGKGAAGNGSCH